MNKPTFPKEPREPGEPTFRTIGCVQGSDAARKGLVAVFEKCRGSQARRRNS